VGIGTILDEFGDAFVDFDVVGCKLGGRQFCGGRGLAGVLQSDEDKDDAVSPLCAASTSCRRLSAACSRFSSRLQREVVSYMVRVSSRAGWDTLI
jgi:hypothetical protein